MAALDGLLPGALSRWLRRIELRTRVMYTAAGLLSRSGTAHVGTELPFARSRFWMLNSTPDR